MEPNCETSTIVDVRYIAYLPIVFGFIGVAAACVNAVDSTLDGNFAC